MQTIFFVNDVDRCYRLKLFLEQFAISAAILNAELPQNRYTRVAHTHTCMHSYIHTYINTYMHTYTYIHTYIHTCI